MRNELIKNYPHFTCAAPDLGTGFFAHFDGQFRMTALT